MIKFPRESIGNLMKHMPIFRYGASVLGGHAKYPGQLRENVHVGGQEQRDGDAKPRDGRTPCEHLRVAHDAGRVLGAGEGAIRHTNAHR